MEREDVVVCLVYAGNSANWRILSLCITVHVFWLQKFLLVAKARGEHHGGEWAHLACSASRVARARRVAKMSGGYVAGWKEEKLFKPARPVKPLRPFWLLLPQPALG
jgi:hypothetical protein